MLDVTGWEYERFAEEYGELIAKNGDAMPVIVDGEEKLYYKRASKKYNHMVFGDPDVTPPFNETAGWTEGDGPDHWFEVSNKFLENAIHDEKVGKFNTTRCPRNIDLYFDPSTSPKDKGTTDPQLFIKKVKAHNIHTVVVLVEDSELMRVGSKRLVEFYEKACGINCIRYPIPNNTSPNEDANFEQRVVKLENILCHLMLEMQARDRNVLIHCWGGSGRTGCVVAGCLRLFGHDDPWNYARRFPGKSIYMDILDQEDWIEQQQFILSEDVVNYSTELAIYLVVEHVRDLVAAVEKYGPDGIIKSRYKISTQTMNAIMMLYEKTDVDDMIQALGPHANELIKKGGIEGVYLGDGVDIHEMVNLLQYCTRLAKDIKEEE